MAEQSGVQWLKDAMDFFDSKAPWRCPRWPILLASFGVLVLVSITMLVIGDALNAQGAVLTRFLARAQAPLTAQWIYKDKAREEITVLLYDQQFLVGSGSVWPISYGEHADNLRRLVADKEVVPKAIFLDITFAQAREDHTITQLADALCEVSRALSEQDRTAVPPRAPKQRLFLAGLANQHGTLSVREELLGRPGTAPCAALVGVDYFPDRLDGLAWSYELSRHWDEAAERWHSGPGDFGEPTYLSAAMAMAQLERRVGRDVGPLALTWGHNSADQDPRPATLAGCREGERSWLRFIPGVIRHFWPSGETPKPLCPYHRTRSMDQLGTLEPAELGKHLNQKYVLVGANVPGYNDFVQSPVHGLLPGIHTHAMALDNFLTDGADYKVSAEWSDPWRKDLLGPALLVIAAVFLVHLAWNLARQWVTVWLVRAVARGDVQRLRARFLRWPTWARWLAPRLARGFAWLARLTLQTIAAMILIALLQKVSRIGMLPVAELVGMTLLAEGLDITRRVRDFLFHPPPSPARIASSP